MTETEYLLPALKGSISVVERDGKVFDVLLHDTPPAGTRGTGRIAKDLADYFSGKVVNFRGHDINFSGYTDFQKRVLKATENIPYGRTKSYKEVAIAAGSPKAARAVGQVMARNRTCIFIPCHRVVGSNGIGGWSGPIEWKKNLLRLEGALEKVEPSQSEKRTRNRAGRIRR